MNSQAVPIQCAPDGAKRVDPEGLTVFEFLRLRLETMAGLRLNDERECPERSQVGDRKRLE